jgi:hypothetical protein
LALCLSGLANLRYLCPCLRLAFYAHLTSLFSAVILASLIRVFGHRAGALPFFDYRLCYSRTSTMPFLCVCYSTNPPAHRHRTESVGAAVASFTILAPFTLPATIKRLLYQSTITTAGWRLHLSSASISPSVHLYRSTTPLPFLAIGQRPRLPVYTFSNRQWVLLPPF